MAEKHPNKIRELRKKSGYTQEGLGKQFKKQKDLTVISRWERGIVRPSASHLIELCKILEVDDPLDIFFGDN